VAVPLRGSPFTPRRALSALLDWSRGSVRLTSFRVTPRPAPLAGNGTAAAFSPIGSSCHSSVSVGACTGAGQLV